MKKTIDLNFFKNPDSTLEELKQNISSKTDANTFRLVEWQRSSTLYDRVERDQWSVLALAIYFNRYDMVEYLLSIGGNLNAPCTNTWFPTFLFFNDYKMFQLLVG
ncbi:MAG: ankyrin repeat domain-containing protein, partial [Pseudomonadota bacterium]|nr:ankyrin repeat domain-containing protein [Pseudomonadota bacterium]